MIFSGDSVQRIISGLKTETRRPVKPQPRWSILADEPPPSDLEWDGSRAWVPQTDSAGYPTELLPVRSPFGVTGDTLWVREKHALQNNREAGEALTEYDFGDRPVWWDDDGWDDDGEVWTVAHYAATDPPPDLCCESPRCRVCCEEGCGPHWRSARFMPKWACRLRLVVEEVWAERLHDITEAGILAEGIQVPVSAPDRPILRLTGKYLPHEYSDKHPRDWTAEDWLRTHFASAWDAINSKQSPWSANDWVFACRFSILDGEGS